MNVSLMFVFSGNFQFETGLLVFDMLVFKERRKPEYSEENLLEQRRESTKSPGCIFL